MDASKTESKSRPGGSDETGAADEQQAEARAVGKTMAYEGFPRSVPLAFRSQAAFWLAGYDEASRR